MLVQFLQKEQKRLSAEAQQKAAASAFDKRSDTGISVHLEQFYQVEDSSDVQTSGMNSQNDPGRVRLKPRDPRRILHDSTTQNSNASGPEQAKMNEAVSSGPQSSKDHLVVREHGDSAQPSGAPPQSAPLPISTPQLTKNLSNTANNVASSQIVFPDLLGVPFYSQLTLWGDVDHLLDGYDDQQRAAIQRERARRIAEQNKMFAARKLCLVLDLDHTLLNSAK
ncbi:RNA polymerase II C-terminal domain phosphatase-like 3, partial [Ananas comosus]